jgi:tRNA dimethylallyltransferase
MMKIEVITGPTASGKTTLALERAEANSDIEIVNADALLLYEGFDIGTAKPSKEIRSRIPHHLIDILKPDEQCNAGDYAKKARDIIRRIIANGKIPLVTGGTGFYIDALFFGIASHTVDEKKLTEAREIIAKEMNEFGFDAMHERLKEIDPELYIQIARERNPRRLERAWEFYYATGMPLGEARKEKAEPFELRPAFTLIEVRREELQKKIIERIDNMLKQGWLKEVEQLLERGVTTQMPGMNAIGYRELAEVLHGDKTIGQARDEIIIRTRQYAKRQVTWIKRYKNS